MNPVWQAVWFFLPAAFANAAPVFAAHLPALRRFDAPLDGGRTWRGQPLLGPHKTWRGIVSGVIVATLVLWLQQRAALNLGWDFGIGYATLPVLVLGPVLGLGALGGDALKSLFKRRFRVAAGRSWLPFDQLDYVIGGLLFSLLVVRLDLLVYVVALIFWFGMHLLVSYVGWRMGLKERPL